MASTHTAGFARRGGLLYPMLVIAAIAVIVFSAVGVATMMGWMPAALSGVSNAPRSAASEQRLAATDTRAPGGALPAVPTAPTPQAAPEVPHAPTAAPVAPECADCGVIESIRAVEVKGDASWMGAGGGAAVGALVGSQIGHGRGQMLASGLGAGAGAYGGIQLEKELKKTVKYQVRVRMPDGNVRTFVRSRQPQFAVGQKVRLTDRGLIAAG